MNDARYSLGLCVNASPEQAFLASLAKPMPTPGMAQHVGAQERAFLALFSVLTESQQERALQRLGWERVRPPGALDPADCAANGCRLGREGKGACAAGFSACKVTP